LFPVTLRITLLPAGLPARMLLPAVLVACLTLICSGCVQTDFQPEKAEGLILEHPIHLDAEQVMLTNQQVDCGVQSELWEQPTQAVNVNNNMVGLTVAHLNAAARELKFDDDVILTEPGFRNPYVQVRGDFPAQLIDPPTIHDDGQYSKKVEGKVTITINHPCFMDPLPLMGVRKGRFSQDAPTLLHFTLENDGWHFDRLVHN
jgi:hypothetical protein